MQQLAKRLAKQLLMRGTRHFGTLTHVNTTEPLVALTFDDGPDPEYTPRIAELLETHGARATFFMVGKRAARYPDVVKRVAMGGHSIGSHSWDHTAFPFLKSGWRRQQIEWCEEAFAPHGDRLFRPPWGWQSLASHFDVHRMGYEVVAWNVMAEDWRDDSAETLAARVSASLEPGAIVLLHDASYDSDGGRRDRSPTVDAVKMILSDPAQRYRFVTVPELIRRGDPVRWLWYKKPQPTILKRV